MKDKRQRSVFTRLMGMQLVSVCISLLIIGVLFGYLAQKYYYGMKEWGLIEQGNRMVGLLQDDIAQDDIAGARERIYTLAESSDIALWVIGQDGEIMAGSRLEREGDSITLEPAEVAHVLAGNSITKKVMGPLFQSLLVVQPLYDTASTENLASDEMSFETIGALAMRAPLGDIGDTVNNLTRLIIIAGLVAGVVVLMISLSLAKGFAKPLEQLKRATLDIAHGRFRRLAIPPHSSEVDLLVQAFNYASEQIKQTSQEQDRLERIRKEFLSDLSHELRAPLTSLKGFLELMEYPLPSAEREKYRQIMLKDTLYVERLVEDVLDLSKMESENFSLKRDWVSPVSIVTRALETLELQFEDKQVTVETDYEIDLPNLYLDAQRMHQVLLNLLVNAIQHSPRRGTITITVSQDGSNVVIVVSDQGPGIPAEHLCYIWERFYKLDKARTRGYQGSGLGLAIVKEIVELHHGKVRVNSSPEQGTTFTLTIPISPD